MGEVSFLFSLQKELEVFSAFLKGVWMDASLEADVLELTHNDWLTLNPWLFGVS